MKQIKRLAAALLAVALFTACLGTVAYGAGHGFTDVPRRAWYAQNVQFVYDAGLMNGTASNRFSPNVKMDRAMLVTVLHRMDGAPPSDAQVPFQDVKQGAYYYPALAWAYENGIISGVSATKFGPNMAVTREMMVTIFYRYGRYKGLDLSGAADLTKYTDSGLISGYARTPFRWAVDAGVIKGSSNVLLSPGGTAIRAECAAVMQRFCLISSDGAFGSLPLEPGPAVSVMGERIGSCLVGNTAYVRLEDFREAADLALSAENGQVCLCGVPLGVSCFSQDGMDYAPLMALAYSLELATFTDTETDGCVYVYPDTGIQVPRGIQVPILMYHAVSNDVWGSKELFVSPESMEQQLQYLLDNGFDPIFFSDLPDADQYDRPVILTFDDGYDDNFQELFPLLQKYQVKATVFLITDTIGGEHKLTEDQILEMSRSGLVSFQSHTASHPHLSGLTEEELVMEMSRSQGAIARLTGTAPEVLCYPYGDYDALAKKVAACFFDYAAVTGPGGYKTGHDPYSVGRYYVKRSTSLEEFAEMVRDAGK